jgi:CRISPR-associated endonuclease/helicase Cas3
MSNSYLLKSHSHPDRILYDHLKSVALRSIENLIKVFPKVSTNFSTSGLARTVTLIGATHDIGKGTSFFQDYLSNPKQVTNPLLKSHSMISSMYCSWIILNDLQIPGEARNFLALASAIVIQGHHGSLKSKDYYTGLSDFITKDIFPRQIESFRCSEELEKISQNLGNDICREVQDMNFVKFRSINEFIDVWEDHFFILQDLISDYTANLIYDDPFEPYFTINLLYAILLDADRMDVAGLEPERLEKIDIESVRNYMKVNYSQINDNNNIINELRNRLFLNLNEKSRIENLDQRIFTLTAATGLGKTLSSLNFTLNLRKRIKEKKGFAPRIIYVAPFISILDQNMDVLQKVFHNETQSSLLMMHHHLAPIDFAKSIIEEQKKKHTVHPSLNY